MAIDPNNNTTYYETGYYYLSTLAQYALVVAKSTNAGVTWERDTITSSTNYIYCQALTVDKLNSNVVYVGGYNGLLYKTTDAGVTWNLANIGLTNSYYIYDIAVHPTNPNIVYAGAYGAAFKSSNAGANWSNIGLSQVNDILVHPFGPDTVYAGSVNGFYKSTNAGATWTAMNNGLLDTYVTSLAVKTVGGRADSTYIFAGTKGGGMSRMYLPLISVAENTAPGSKIMFSISPNPTADRTLITYELDSPANVQIAVYDIQGRSVNRVLSTKQGNGSYRVIWQGGDENGDQVANGIYFIKLTTDDSTFTRQIVVIR